LIVNTRLCLTSKQQRRSLSYSCHPVFSRSLNQGFVL